MFSIQSLYGSSLGHKTLCLTFDDGPGESLLNIPGPKTLPLAEYLSQEGIGATFFVVGKFASNHLDLLSKIMSLGHLIGNHTYNHPQLTNPASFLTGETIVSELAKTERLISRHSINNTLFFRAPYGSWSPENSIELNTQLQTTINYIGPIGWDIDAADWQSWQQRKTADKCASNYLLKIEEVGRGIILMHDSSADADPQGEYYRNGNLTYETIKILIPKLKNLGYQFVRLDKVTLVEGNNLTN